jgi:hypothetical protein
MSKQQATRSWSDLSDRTDIVDDAYCLLGRLSTAPRLLRSGSGARTRGRGISARAFRCSSLVCEAVAVHHGWGVFPVHEEACADGLAVYLVAEAVVPSCLLKDPAFRPPGEAGGVEIRAVALQSIACSCSLVLRAPSGGCPCGWVRRWGRRHARSVLGPQGTGGRRRGSRASWSLSRAASVPGQVVSTAVPDIPHAHSNAALAAAYQVVAPFPGGRAASARTQFEAGGSTVSSRHVHGGRFRVRRLRSL